MSCLRTGTAVPGQPKEAHIYILAIPSFLGITWMTVVLARVHDPKSSRRLRLWVMGLVLITLEGIARLLYNVPSFPLLAHRLAHVAALDAYFLAGVAFLRSSASENSRNATGRWYLLLSSIPYLLLLSCYGMSVKAQWVYVGIAALGLVGSPLLALLCRKTPIEALSHSAIWSLVAWGLGSSTRLAAYLALALVFAITAAAFAFRLDKRSKGRWVVVASFVMWGLCFLAHPWVAEHHPAWAPMLDQVWDLQRYLVTFGVLIYSLEERVALNEFAALHDALTGVANRTLFDSRLRNAIARSRRRGSRVLLLTLDMSGFKQVNDTFGHPVGDALLKQVAQRLKGATRETDTVARLGGDEFSVILEDIDGGLARAARPDAMAVRCDSLAQKLRSVIEDSPFLLPVGGMDRPAELQVAVGTAIFPDDADTPEELYQRSDESMYADKKRLREVEALTALVG